MDLFKKNCSNNIYKVHQRQIDFFFPVQKYFKVEHATCIAVLL